MVGQLGVGTTMSQQNQLVCDNSKLVNCSSSKTQRSSIGPSYVKHHLTNLNKLSTVDPQNSFTLQCHTCRKSKNSSEVSKCTNCSAYYCSRVCQQLHWTNSHTAESVNSDLVNNSSSKIQRSSSGPNHTKHQLTKSNKLTDQNVHVCDSCRKDYNKISLSKCTGCGIGYCSSFCKQKHFNNKPICHAIQELEKRDEDNSVFDHLSNKQRAKVVRLVGKKCLLKCLLQNKEN